MMAPNPVAAMDGAMKEYADYWRCIWWM